MFLQKQRVTEQDFRRFLTDLESQHDLGSAMKKRENDVQRLMAKLYTLSNEEFENAFQTLAALVDSAIAKKTVDKKPPGNREAVLTEVNNHLTQNQRKIA